MNLLDIFFLSLGVSLDSLAISVCKGVNSDHPLPLAFKCGFCFSLFQIFMPLVAFYVGRLFAPIIDCFDHFIVFGVFFIFGVNMLIEAFKKDAKPTKTGFFSLLIIAFFSSFDSLGVGFSIALYDFNIFVAVAIICSMTFVFSFTGVFIGKLFESKNRKFTCILSGMILIVLGFKILIEHLFFL